MNSGQPIQCKQEARGISLAYCPVNIAGKDQVVIILQQQKHTILNIFVLLWYGDPIIQ